MAETEPGLPSILEEGERRRGAKNWRSSRRREMVERWLSSLRRGLRPQGRAANCRRSIHRAAKAATDTGGSRPTSPTTTTKFRNLTDTTIWCYR
jgi:hypothetical protein